jgi:capsular exopolysaccharide synthesis family protein
MAMSPSQPALPGPNQSLATRSEGGSALQPAPSTGQLLPARDAALADGDWGTSADSLPPALTEGATPVTLVQALRRRWLQALPVGLMLAVLAGGLVWVLRPDRYTAFTLLRIAPSEQKILEDNTPRQEPDRTGQYQKTQVVLIKSRAVIREALKEDAVRSLPLLSQQSDPVDWLEKELRAEIVDNTELLRVSLTSRHNQENLRPILKAVRAAYLKEIAGREDDQLKTLLGDVEKIHSESQESLRKQREALRQLADTLQTNDSQILSIKQKNLLEEYASLKRELAGLQAKLRDAQVKLAGQRAKLAEGGGSAKNAVTGGPLQAAVDREVDADPVVLKQVAEVYKLEEQLAQIDRVAANPRTPLRVDRQHKLDAARAVLAKLRKERRQAVAERLSQGLKAERQLQTRETEEEMKILENQRKELLKELSKVGGEVGRMGVSSIDLELKRNEVEQAEVVLKALRNQKERLQVELQSKKQSTSDARRRVVPMDDVEEAAVLNKKSRLMESMAAAFGGLFVGLFGVSYREFRKRMIYTPGEVERGLRLRVVGSLPAIPARGARGGAHLAKTGAEDWSRLLLESVDSIRTMLLQGRPQGGSALLMIASACSGEGKTTLAGLLAASLARAGRRTLLVDGDLRRPSLHRLFGVTRTPGVCELMTGGAATDDAVHATPVDRLHVLSAGQYSPEAATALARGDLQELFGQLRGQFDFIVVDSSPLLAVSDALMIGGGADGVVFSIRPGVSQAPQVHAAYERVRELGLPVLGTVVNGVRDKAMYTHRYQYLSGSAAD